MDSLEEKVSLFMDDENYCESELCDGSHDHMEDFWWSGNNAGDGDSDDHRAPDITLYWESQVALLQEILERYQKTGSKLRQEVGKIIKEVKASDFCSCMKLNPSDCTSCLRKRVVALLSDKGFNTKLCISKWCTTQKFPGGSHEYIEVVSSTITRKKQVTFLIELEFRDQFQIAKAGKSYQKLVTCLPEFYIGKPDYLTAIVRIMCDAAKKSMKEKKMHMGPWRKIGFMQMKWSGFNQTWTFDDNSNNNKDEKYAQASESYIRISGAPPSVTVT